MSSSMREDQVHTCGGRAFTPPRRLPDVLQGCPREVKALRRTPWRTSTSTSSSTKRGTFAHWFGEDLAGLARGGLGGICTRPRQRSARATISLDVRREGGSSFPWLPGRQARPGRPLRHGLPRDGLARGSGRVGSSAGVLPPGRRSGRFESAFGISALGASPAPLRLMEGCSGAPLRVARRGNGARLRRCATQEDKGVRTGPDVRVTARRWAAGNSETDAQGEFKFAAPGSGYTLGLWLNAPRNDGVEEWIHAGPVGRGRLRRL